MSKDTPLGTFNPPEKFSFEPRDWLFWKQRFQRFRQLTKLDKEAEELQINALIYSMGEKADEILASFNLAAADATKFDKVIAAFETYYIGKRNIVYERARFGLRSQEEGETIESYLTSLHTLAEYCNYGALKDELVRDRIVLGVRDKKLSEKLMLMEALDLTKAVSLCKQWEAVKRQQGDLKGEGKTQSLDSVGKKQGSSNNKKGQSQPQSSSSSDPAEKKQRPCKFCNKNHEWKKEKCPAYGKTCAKCGGSNHFAACCRKQQSGDTKHQPSSSMNNVTDSTECSFVIGTINEIETEPGNSRSKKWTALISVDEKPIDFKLDSGADVTAIPYYLFRKTWRQRRLTPPDRRLTGPDGTALAVVGTVYSSLRNGENEMKQKVYVIKGLEKPLLGLKACEELQLVKRLNSVTSDPDMTDVKPKEEFPQLFTGLGKIDTPYTIKLRDGARPHAIFSPRRVPIPLMEKVKGKLENLVREGVIEPVDEPSEWCAALVTVPKPNGEIRICADLTALNHSVERELHPMPVVDHTLGQLAGAKIFSRLDANSGFYQILLSPECRNLTTFMTPFGRFRYKRLPFGISSAPEHFQKRMMEILKDIPGVVIHVDDILVFGSTKKQHDERLRTVLRKLKEAGVTLNAEKCLFGVSEVKFLGHNLREGIVEPDPEKVKAISERSHPTDVTEIKRFLGMTNFLGRFIPHLSTVSKPLYELTQRDREFLWGPEQDRAFTEVKKILTSDPSLAMYDHSKKTIVSSDASSYGLGSVLLQQQADGNWKAVAFASRTMTSAEQRYAQIEKEALAMTWACERFRDYLMGKEFVIQTDHKPLLPIMTSKSIDDLSPRLQRFRIRLMRYTFSVVYVPGKELVTADALSRQPLKETGSNELEEDVKAFVCQVIEGLPVTDEKLSEIWRAQVDDPIINQVMKLCMTSWPEKSGKLNEELHKYWNVRDTLSVHNGLLLKDTRIVIPRCLQEEILGKIHDGHFGVVKCRARARATCWWPGVSEDIAEVVRRCPVCVQERKERKEPLMPLEFPSRPWQRLGMDLFKSHGRWFILVVDYFSRYPEIAELKNLSTASVTQFLKSIFARHGVPEEVISDNGPQFHPVKTSPFRTFAKEYGFIHTTSSPHYPQSNGFVENGVKIAKNLLTKNEDWFKALLEYRATPLSNGYSPAELLMGRRIRSTLPMEPARLIPRDVNKEVLFEKEEQRRFRQKMDYDKRHGVVVKEEFTPGEIVWIKDLRSWGTVRNAADTPRSFFVDTSRGEFRRNSSHLTRAYRTSVPEDEPEIEDTQSEVPVVPSPERNAEIPEREYSTAITPPMVTRSGRHLKPRRRLIEEI
ncbi:unnamed protein product [Orchesella dallaii]|uniref:RNA-directed DNA polymerase n=1 Tax=Orchesella dallaii TaxID=48710 RepID=A0ABP1RZA3_9HEXA